MKYFTTYWRNPTWEYNRKFNDTPLLNHTASDKFWKRVQTGDAVYIVTVIKGKLFVACKIIVDQICDRRNAVKLLGTTDLWEADDHIIASSSTRIDWNRTISDKVTRKLEFYSPDRTKKNKLKFKSVGFLDVQTLRGNRELTQSSAALLDGLLGELFPISRRSTAGASVWEKIDGADRTAHEFESAAEGAPGKRHVTYYERKKVNRDAAIRLHGLDCKGCGMNFERTYGSHGKGFIHVHHTVPVSQFEKARKVDVKKEMTVLCPNCHAMVHKNKKRTLTISELRALIRNK